ncbi:hypothetical protein NXV12_31105 [Bacteroides thetaiotaomicron]|nr:hypothetical protein [Bacteroides thetaiotaomicron]
MNLYKILPALLILSLLAACSSDKENDVYTTLPFSLSIYQVAMTIEGGEQSQRIFRRRMASSIHCDWMTLSPSSGGIGITKVRIKVKKTLPVYQEMDGLQSSQEKKKKELPLCNRL